LLPLAASARLKRALPLPLRLVVLYFVLSFLQDCVEMWLGSHGVNNLWLSHVTLPLTSGLWLWAFSLWQENEVARLTFRLAILFFIVVWVGLLLFVENLREFSRFGDPLNALLVVCVAAYTLATASARSQEPVWRFDWFWVSWGALLSYGGSAILMPMGNLLLTTSREHLYYLFDIHAWIDIAANLLITGGVLCARPRPNFGGFFWQRHSLR
jgi:hypothetical protein